MISPVPSYNLTRHSDFFQSLGKHTFAPLLRAYVVWLHQSAMRDGVSRLVFLARDGYLMKQAYEAMIPETEQLQTTYMYASRRLLNVAAIDVLDEAALSFLTRDRVSMPVRLYLQRIGMDALECGDQLAAAGLNDGLDTQIGPHNLPNLRQFLQLIEPQILIHTRAERRKLLEYAAGVADWQPGRCAVVDIGWNGSLQESLMKVLGMSMSDLRGYYLCLERQAREHAGYLKTAFLDESRPADYALYRFGVKPCIELFELLFSEQAGSIIGLNRVAGGYEPIREKFDITSGQNKAISVFQRQILKSVQELGYTGHSFKLQSWLKVLRLLSFPKPVEAQALGEILHRSGFGGHGELGYIAKPSMPGWKYLLRPNRFIAERRNVYWPEGFTVRLFSDRFRN